MFMFICGPHASGKTSILKILERDKIITGCGYEIGKELFYRENFIPHERDEDFEIMITRLELERDSLFAKTPGVCASETWHPGNLAYVAVRNPKSFPKLLAIIKESPLLNHAWGIRLTATLEQMHERTKTFSEHDDKNGVVDFLSRVGEKIEYCLDALGLTERTITLDTSQGLEATAERVKEIIRDKCI